MEQGKIIFLNGISSSGKTTLVRALQDILDGYYFHTGIDQYIERSPTKFHVSSDGKEPSTADGLLWVFPDGCQQVSEIRIGSVGYRLIAGMYSAAAALASIGNDLIIDDVIFDQRVLQIAVRTLLPFHVLFVGVRCSLEIAEQRERERGDRIEGLARFQYPLVHSHGTYDFEVDTSTSSPTVCANQIKQFLQDGSAPKAFHILQDTFARE